MPGRPDELRRLLEISRRGPQKRTASVVSNAIDVAARTVEVAFSSETESVERFFGVEVLGHGPGEVDLSRLQNGAPVLWDHNGSDQRGVIETARIDPDGVGRARLRFGFSPAADQLFQDIANGIVSKVSVGYSIEGLRLVEERGDVPVYRVTAWTPHEISMVSVPADDTVGVGRAAADALSHRSLERGHPNIKETPTPMNEISTLLADALRAPGDMPHFNGDGEVRAVTKRTPSSTSRLSLRTTDAPAFVPTANRSVHLPSGTESVKRSKLAATMINSSRVLAAGTQLIVSPEPEPAIIYDGIPTFRRQEVRFEHVAPAQFVTVLDGDQLTRRTTSRRPRSRFPASMSIAITWEPTACASNSRAPSKNCSSTANLPTRR
jgi:HK97 family phage prohead protease